MSCKKPVVKPPVYKLLPTFEVFQKQTKHFILLYHMLKLASMVETDQQDYRNKQKSWFLTQSKKRTDSHKTLQKKCNQYLNNLPNTITKVVLNLIITKCSETIA